MERRLTSFFVSLFFIVLLCMMNLSPILAYLEPPVDSSWASTIPTIDGNLAAGEWVDATVRDFTLEMRWRSDGSLNDTLNARFYVKNNWTHIFTAVEIFNEDYDARDITAQYDGLFILFEDDHDGIVSAGDNGEGVTMWSGSPFYSRNDLYYTGSYWDSDVNAGQTNDGALAWSHTNPIEGAIGNYTFEMMIPLVGSDGDSYDLDIATLPKTVGFKIWFHDECCLDGVYPDDPAITKNVEEIGNGATFGELILHPLYTLTIVTTPGGTTNLTLPGQYQYAYGTNVDVLAIQDAGYEFDHWKLDDIDVGTDNPYSVLMDQNHTLKAVFVEELSASISPTDVTIILGDYVTFTSTVSGGTPSYSYQWYLDSNEVSGAESSSWTFTPTSTGIYYVYLNVTDNRGRIAVSNTARVTVITLPVGGYSISVTTNVNTLANPIVCYVVILAIFSSIAAIIRRKKL